MDVVNRQEHIFKLLAVEGDVIHKTKIEATHWICSCGYEDLKYRCPHTNPDLTTPDGAFWLLKRLPEWDRFEEFIDEVVHSPNSYYIDYFLSCDDDVSFTAALFRWLTTDAKDGKAPALFEALCEFEGLEVEG